MFTGLVEGLGSVDAVTETPDGLRIRVRGSGLIEDVAGGDSIAINGVCQTAIEFGPGWFEVIAVSETLRRTTFGELRPGDRVNLERPLRVGDRLGGHWVQGHVDGTGRIEEVREGEKERAFLVSLPRQLAVYVVEKGSIAIDGVSLTVGKISDCEERTDIWVHIIPETLTKTRFGEYEPHDQVNIEVDILGKYLVRARDLGKEPFSDIEEPS